VITENEDAFLISASDLTVMMCRRESWSWLFEFRSDAQNVTWTLTIGGTLSVAQTGIGTTDSAEHLELLVGKSVSSIRGRKSNAELEIKFDDGALLRVAPDPDYEAWEMYSTRGERLIAVPGDGIAKWGEAIVR